MAASSFSTAADLYHVMSRIIKLIPQSSCKAELAIVSIACKDLRYIMNLAEDCGLCFSTPIDVFTDNKGCYDCGELANWV